MLFRMNYFREKMFSKGPDSIRRGKVPYVTLTELQHNALDDYKKKQGKKVTIADIVNEMIEYCLVQLAIGEQINIPDDEWQTLLRIKQDLESNAIKGEANVISRELDRFDRKSS